MHSTQLRVLSAAAYLTLTGTDIPRASDDSSFQPTNGQLIAQESPPAMLFPGIDVSTGERFAVCDDGRIRTLLPSMELGREVGTISPDGGFTLSGRGISGSVFTSNRIAFDYVVPFASSNFGRELEKARAEFGRANSDIPRIRENLTERGAGVTILTFDSPADPRFGVHTRQTDSIIIDKEVGIAPEARVVHHAIEVVSITQSTEKFDLAWFETNLAEAAAATLQEVTAVLRSESEKKTDPAVSIIYLPLARTTLSLALPRVAAINSNDGTAVRTAIFGNTPPGDTVEFLRRLCEFIDGSLQNNPFFQRTLNEYRQAAQAAYDKGIIIIASAGNLIVPHDALNRAHQFNYLGLSEHVITVGCSNSNRTPGDPTDDILFGASAHGGELLGVKVSPTLCAPGSGVLVRTSPESELLVQQGTSQAAPYVAGTCALIINRDPRITPTQLRSVLLAGCTPLKGVPNTVAGAGTLDPVRAVGSVNPNR